MNILKKIAWMLFVSNRFWRVDRKGMNALTSLLSSLGIAFGVMTLIVVMAVMNGFQSGYIESILEISSFHVRAECDTKEAALIFESLASQNDAVRSIVPFFDAQGLVVGKNSRQQSSMLRFVPSDIMDLDRGFANQVIITGGTFDLQGTNTVIGSSLARTLGVGIGDTINILAMSGSSDVELISDSRIFTVSGIFTSEYSEINNSFMFFSLDVGTTILGENKIPLYGLKLYNSERDAVFISNITNDMKKMDSDAMISLESWRNFNRSFFGALRMEKNLLMLLVFMIFIVVGVNIFNSMRRMVFERREDIAVLTALGSTSSKIQLIFIIRGLLIGVAGASLGLILGILISVNMDVVFMLISKTMYYIQYFFVMIFNADNLYLVRENPMFMFYAQISTKMQLSETVLITLFGVLSSFCASWFASRKILKLFAAEVLRYE